MDATVAKSVSGVAHGSGSGWTQSWSANALAIPLRRRVNEFDAAARHRSLRLQTAVRWLTWAWRILLRIADLAGAAVARGEAPRRSQDESS